MPIIQLLGETFPESGRITDILSIGYIKILPNRRITEYSVVRLKCLKSRRNAEFPSNSAFGSTDRLTVINPAEYPNYRIFGSSAEVFDEPPKCRIPSNSAFGIIDRYTVKLLIIHAESPNRRISDYSAFQRNLSRVLTSY